MARKKAARTGKPQQASKVDAAKRDELIAEDAGQLKKYAAEALAVAKELGVQRKPLEPFWLSPAQRAVLLSLPRLSQSLKTKLATPKASFTVSQAIGMMQALAVALSEAEPRQQQKFLLVAMHLVERVKEGVVELARPTPGKAGRRKVPAPSDALFQFKITVLGSKPPIWRRIQVEDCTLDKLHEHIQTAMGWTNSHLHEFLIDGERCGDPELLDDDFERFEGMDSTRTLISAILPKSGKRFRCAYEYDFGDSWQHEVLFEGCPKGEARKKYPLCVEGERACPPEDVGGIDGYDDFLEVLADPNHEDHADRTEWIGGTFDPDKFDAEAATREMRKGLPDWRNES